MLKQVKHVSKIALFYDLVFVYMISKTTEILHHLEHGLVSPTSFFFFTLIVLIFINSWMIQTIFTNRYGKGSWGDIAFYFTDMMIILYMSNSFDTNNITEMRILFISAGLLSMTLCLHYFINYFQVNKKIDKKISQTYFIILLIRAISLIIGGILDNAPGLIIALIGIMISWLAPVLTKKEGLQHPIIFAHLLERLNLLVIIIFGETIIGVAEYFKVNTFNFYSILIFLAVAFLFFTYALQFDQLLEENQPHASGDLLIYLHYLIIFSISLITVGFKFINEKEASSYFAVLCLYVGISLFYLGLSLASKYNKVRFSLSAGVIVAISVLTLGGCLICLYLPDFKVISITTCLITFLNALILVHHFLPSIKKGILS